jgi:hypothetical protein
MAANPHATIEELLDKVFYTLSVPRYVEAGSNTSTVTLQVVGGDEKGSLESETVKYDHDSQGTWTRERLRWRGPSTYIKDRHVLSPERVPLKNKTVTVKL